MQLYLFFSRSDWPCWVQSLLGKMWSPMSCWRRILSACTWLIVLPESDPPWLLMCYPCMASLTLLTALACRVPFYWPLGDGVVGIQLMASRHMISGLINGQMWQIILRDLVLITDLSSSMGTCTALVDSTEWSISTVCAGSTQKHTPGTRWHQCIFAAVM